MGKIVSQAIGNVGKDPEDGMTSAGPVTRFSLAVTRSYPDMGQENGETRWLSIAVFKDSIRDQVKGQIRKGSRVAVEGTITQSEYLGKPQYGMKASRVGLVEWFMPSAADKAKSQATFGQKATATSQSVFAEAASGPAVPLPAGDSDEGGLDW